MTWNGNESRRIGVLAVLISPGATTFTTSFRQSGDVRRGTKQRIAAPAILFDVATIRVECVGVVQLVVVPGVGTAAQCVDQMSAVHDVDQFMSGE